MEGEVDDEGGDGEGESEVDDEGAGEGSRI